MGTKQFGKVVFVALAVAGLFLGVLPGLVAAAYNGGSSYKGEELSTHALLRVESVDGQVLLHVGRPKPGLLARTFTMSDCGRELTPNMANLLAMVGKPLVGWSLASEKGMMVYHRLEFQCN